MIFLLLLQIEKMLPSAFRRERRGAIDSDADR